MLHHVFEHIAHPQRALASLKRLLAPGGTILLRIPTTSSFAWRHYGVNWVQLDAPRHLHLYSVGAIRQLAKQSGFNEIARVYDSTDFQFWGSDQLARDLPLLPHLYVARRTQKKQRSEARHLNNIDDGDSVAFFLCHAEKS